MGTRLTCVVLGTALACGAYSGCCVPLQVEQYAFQANGDILAAHKIMQQDGHRPSSSPSNQNMVPIKGPTGWYAEEEVEQDTFTGNPNKVNKPSFEAISSEAQCLTDGATAQQEVQDEDNADELAELTSILLPTLEAAARQSVGSACPVTHQGSTQNETCSDGPVDNALAQHVASDGDQLDDLLDLLQVRQSSENVLVNSPQPPVACKALLCQAGPALSLPLTVINHGSTQCNDDVPLISKRAPPLTSLTGFTGSPGPPAPGLAFEPHASWSMQMCRLLYVGVFLTNESRDVLCSVVPVQHSVVIADHMTLVYKPTVEQLLNYPLGAEVDLKVIGQAKDSRAQAVAVDPPHWLPPTTSVSMHITVSVAPGIPPKEAGFLLADAMQRTAMTRSEEPVMEAAGAYEHFDDGLVLIGHIGVRLDDNRTVFSLADLAECVTLHSSNVEVYNRKHAAILSKVLGNVVQLSISLPHVRLSVVRMHLLSCCLLNTKFFRLYGLCRAWYIDYGADVALLCCSCILTDKLVLHWTL